MYNAPMSLLVHDRLLAARYTRGYRPGLLGIIPAATLLRFSLYQEYVETNPLADHLICKHWN